MEEGDTEEEIYEDEEEGDDEVEYLEDLKTIEEIQEEDRNDAEKKRKKIKLKYRKKGDVLDMDYPEIFLNNSQVIQEPKYKYTSAAVIIKPSQRNLICFVQQYLGIKNRNTFITHALLNFCRTQMKIVQARKEADLKFIEEYNKIRRDELIMQNKLKARIEKLRQMAPAQDDGGDPFTVDDLTE